MTDPLKIKDKYVWDDYFGVAERVEEKISVRLQPKPWWVTQWAWRRFIQRIIRVKYTNEMLWRPNQQGRGANR